MEGFKPFAVWFYFIFFQNKILMCGLEPINLKPFMVTPVTLSDYVICTLTSFINDYSLILMLKHHKHFKEPLPVLNLFVGLFIVFINIQTLIYSKYYFKTKIDEFKGYTLIKRRNKIPEKKLLWL